jgi:predicted ATPase
MLNSLLIENFKCFKKQLIPLSPLTLFTGFNAAGKSSAIQTILLGSQLLRDPNGGRAAPLNGECIKLGTIGDVRCHHSSEKEIRIKYSSMLSDLSLILDASDRVQSSIPLTVKEDENSSDIYNYLKDVIYISGTRHGTLDVYPTPNESKPIFANVGECGQYAPWWFEKYSDEEIIPEKFHINTPAKTLRKQFNAWASELFPGFEANTESIERTPLIRLELRTSLQDQWKRPANIGYGLTYAFPILVAGLLAKKGQILIVDSPEAHLHPLGQSRIGYFLGVIAASGVQVIVETHSDHVLNGVRLAVAKKAIKNQSVCIHFFNSSTPDTDHSPQIISPQIDINGSLSEWPDGFFDQTDKDLAILNGWG